MVCEGMFEHFVTPDGQRKHYFGFDPIQQLVQDPILVAPPPPTGLRRIFQSRYPAAPTPLDLTSSVRPRPFTPTPPAPFLPANHALPTPPHECDLHTCPLSGLLPDRPIHFDVQREIVVESSSSDEEVQPQFEWDINKSMWGPRKVQAECRSFYDHGTTAEKRAFDVDWRRVAEKSRVQVRRVLVCSGGGGHHSVRNGRVVHLFSFFS